MARIVFKNVQGGPNFRFVFKRTTVPPEPPPEPGEANFSFDPAIYEPPAGGDTDFIFSE